MILFQKTFSQKSIAGILIIVITLLAISPILLLPSKAQAKCLVSDLSGTAAIKAQTAVIKINNAKDGVSQNAQLGKGTLTAANSVWDKAKQLVKWAGGVLLNLMLHQLLAQLTNEITNWIENGEEPRFMTEGIGDYLEDAADNAVGAFIDQYLGLGFLCEPFDIDIKIALLGVPTFDTGVRCSLSDIVSNIDNFYEDFSSGGWKGWVALAQPQNDFYGALLLAQGEKTRMEEEAKKMVEADAEMGDGFLSQKDCYWYDATGSRIATQKNVRGYPKLPAACKPNAEGLTPGVVRPCTPSCQVRNPGTAIKTMADETIVSAQRVYYEQMGAATAKAGPYAVYVQAIANAFINRIMQEGMELFKEEPSPPTPPLTFTPPPTTPDPGSIASLDQVMQDQADAQSLSDQLELLEDYTDDYLDEQKTNLAVLKLIPTAYETASSTLGQTITACASITPSDAAWAAGQITQIRDNTIPSFNVLIDQLENTNISDTLTLISDIASAVSLTDDFDTKAGNWVTAWENALGDITDLTLIAAEDAMDDAEDDAIESIQAILTMINGTYSASNFIGLNSETTDAINNTLDAMLDLEDERGSADWPESGTLYGDLEDAADLKDEAADKTDDCITAAAAAAAAANGGGGNGP